MTIMARLSFATESYHVTYLQQPEVTKYGDTVKYFGTRTDD